MPEVIADNLDLWTSTILNKSTAGRGRGSNGRQEAYGVKKLRELILELAVRGELVPQDPSDEPASELLERIAEEKEALVMDGRIKKGRPQAEISEFEIPHRLPATWAWVRFGDIAQHNAGKTLDSKRNTGEPRDYLTTSNLYWGYFDLTEVRQMLIRDDELEKCTARKGDLLIVEGGDAGRAAVWHKDYEVCIQNHIHRVRMHSDTNAYYAYRYFEKLSATAEIENYRKGVGISSMSGKALASIIYALPPVAEQVRIVAKVDELMALCDQLEQQQTDSTNTHQTLVETLLGTLTSVESPEDLTEAWNRIAGNFDTLFTTEQSIDQLNQTILQLAVMGKLVPQDPNDDPASSFLRNIDSELVRLANGKKVKKRKPLKPIGEDEKPHDLPDGWEWRRIASIALVGTGATPSRDNPSYYKPPEFSWVTSGETRSALIYETKEMVSLKALQETNVSIYPVGTLVVAMYGQGKTRGQVTELMIEAGTNQACAAIQLVEKNEAHRKYIKLHFQNAYEEIRSRAAGGAQPNLNIGKISLSVLSIPPLSEQVRIVAKVEELMSLCDALTARLLDAKITQVKLADAIVEQAVA